MASEEVTLGEHSKWGALQQLGQRVRPYWGWGIAAAVGIVFGTAVGLAFPLFVRNLVDAAFLQEQAGRLNTILLTLVGLFALMGCMRALETGALGVMGERIIARLRVDLFERLLSFRADFFVERSSGELTSRLTSDCSTLQSVLTSQTPQLMRNFLNLVGGLAMLAILHTHLMLVTIAIAPIVAGLGVYFGRRLKTISTRVQDRLADANARAEEALAQSRVVKSFTREVLETDLYGERIQSTLEAALDRVRDRAIMSGLMIFCAYLGLAIVLWQGAHMVLEGSITAGELVSFLLYAVTVAGAIGNLASLWGSFQGAMGAAERVFGLLEHDQHLPRAEPPAPMPDEACSIELEEVSFQYDEHEPWVLKDLDLSIDMGESVALVGRSGAGKSTLAALLPRFWDPDQGQIRWGDVDLAEFQLQELRSEIGVVPQSPDLFGGTIADNIRFGDPEASMERVRQAGRAAHVDEFVDNLPDGYETKVGEGGVKLSGGQRQRVALARVFLKDPQLVILDEATSHLDAESERHIDQALEQLMAESTTLIIAHRLQTVQKASRVVVLDQGRIVASGPHEELIQTSSVYHKLYATGEIAENGDNDSADKTEDTP